MQTSNDIEARVMAIMRTANEASDSDIEEIRDSAVYYIQRLRERITYTDAVNDAKVYAKIDELKQILEFATGE